MADIDDLESALPTVGVTTGRGRAEHVRCVSGNRHRTEARRGRRRGGPCRIGRETAEGGRTRWVGEIYRKKVAELLEDRVRAGVIHERVGGEPAGISEKRNVTAERECRREPRL